MKIVLQSLAFGIFCLAIDQFFKDVVVTPLLSLCWLMWLAKNKIWKDVILAFCISVVFVVVSLHGQELPRMSVRLASFFVAGYMAVAFSKLRANSLSALSSAQAIISATPTPMIAADITGSIVSASDETLKILPADFIPVVGHSFADVFMGNLSPGFAMKQYLDWFNVDGQREAQLFLRVNPGIPLTARILTTGRGNDRLLVAAIVR